MRLTMVLLAAVLAVTGCSTPEPTPAPDPSVLTVGLLDPGNVLRDRMINHALYTPLVDYDPATGKVTLVGAESVTSTDQITWTVRLKPSTYHDGTPVTANSYVDAWLDIKGHQPVPYQEIASTDHLTVRFVATAPASYFPAFLASVWAAPVRWSAEGVPVGNGPFRLASPWEKGKGGRLIRVAQADSKVSEIDLRVYADPVAGRERRRGTHFDHRFVRDLDAALDDVRAGTLDLVADVPRSTHAAMRQEFAGRHVRWPLPQAAYLAFGPDMPDPAARYAISMSVDRKSLAEGLPDNQADPATRLYPPAVAPGEGSGICRACEHDPAAAKSLRDQVDLRTLRITEDDERAASALAEQIRAVLDVKTDFGPGPQLFIMNWNIDSPHEFFTYPFDIPAARPMIDAAAAAGNAEEQVRNYRLAENQILGDLSIVPLWTAHGHAVWAERVRDVTASAAHGIDMAAITL